MRDTIEFTMHRKAKGSRTLFYPTINGKRLTSTNWARKSDARNLVKNCLKHYGAETMHTMFYK